MNAEEVNRVLGNLVAFILKQDDAPASAQFHLDAAIDALYAHSSWASTDEEKLEIVWSAIEHMNHYRDNKIETPDHC